MCSSTVDVVFSGRKEEERADSIVELPSGLVVPSISALETSSDRSEQIYGRQRSMVKGIPQPNNHACREIKDVRALGVVEKEMPIPFQLNVQRQCPKEIVL